MLISFSQDSEMIPSTPKSDMKAVRNRWTPSEDMVLIDAWLNTCKEPTVGNEQKAGTYWDRISSYYTASEAVAGKAKRGPTLCRQRWRKIKEGVIKFDACYSQAGQQRISGQSDGEVLQMAYELYLNYHKAKFTFEHAWVKLRHDQKWCTYQGNDRSKRTKLDAGGAYSSSSNTTSKLDEVEACPRPLGVNASKGKAKKSGTSEEIKFERMWEIKEKDIAGRERLSKQRLLDRLIAKTDLSELELNLKNKLIAEMLG